MTPYQLHEKAHFEYIESYRWYELRQKGLGDRFMNCVEERLIQISTNPEFYPKRHGNFREVKVRDFPYSIVYELLKKKNLIHIAAIYHNKRNPKHKFRRV
ncbi:MAG: type II toxin-antitoxin system RelE/ParE family toxin [Bacteroidia bacterium]